MLPNLGLLLGSAAGAGAPSLEAVPLEAQVLFIGVVFLGTLIVSRFSIRIGVPAILGVLALGLMINIHVLDVSHGEVEKLHVFALALLLFYAGLKTDIQSIRGFLEYGLLLAVGGVAISTLILGAAIYWLSSASGSNLVPGLAETMPLGAAFLIAACLGSTDAGATLSVLSSVSRFVPDRVRRLLEFESSVNDPAAILFLLLVVGLSFTKPEVTQTLNDVAMTGIPGQIQAFIKSIGSGIMVGLILTYLGQYILRHFVTSKDQVLIVGIAISVAAYGLSTLLLGSGFISAYVTGLFLANNIYDNPLITSESLENSLESFNTMMEMLVFLLFGVIINPSNISLVLPEGILCSLALMLVARPLSVLAFSWVSPFNWRENVLIAWCGLRGAVPLALSYTVIHTIHELPGISAETTAKLSGEVEGLIFLVVLLNLSIQGLTLPVLSRRLGLRGDGPEASPTTA